MKYLPNLITSLNLLTGSLGCFLLARGELAIPLVLVCIAAFFDLLDGFVARLAGVSSPMGKELDSLADVVSFGLFPAFYMSLLIAERTTSYLYFAGLLIAIFSALRLAKFNIDEEQSDKFIGLPTPANALMICSLGFLPEEYLGLPVLLGITVISCLLLIAPVEMIALKFKDYRWRGNATKYLLLLITILLLALFQWKALPFVIPIYIVFSLIGNYLIKQVV